MAMPPPSGPPMPPPNAGGPPADQAPPRDIASEIEAMLPEPTRSYKPKVLMQVEEALRETWAKVEGLPPIPEGAMVPEGYTGEGKLPISIMAPVVVLLSLAADSGGKRYDLDLAELTDDTALHKVVGMLKTLKGDKKILKAMSESIGGGPVEEEESVEEEFPMSKGPPPMPKAIRPPV